MIIVVSFTLIIIITPFVWGSCGTQQVMINDGLQKYDQEITPDSCLTLVEQIIEFNENCDSEIEIVDCG